MDTVDKLYHNYDILADPKNRISEHEAEYLEIIESVKGDTQAKMLASQFIPRFVKDFPEHAVDALNAQLDLLEDPDVAIRKHAVKHLPNFCKEYKQSINKVADALTQLLQSPDNTESSSIHNALMTILKMDVQATFLSVLNQITTSDLEIIRRQASQFLAAKFKFLPPELITKEVEDFIIEKIKEAFPTLGREELAALMPMVANLKSAKTLSVQESLVNIISERANFKGEFQIIEEDLALFMECMHAAQPFFSSSVGSSYFVHFISKNILPSLSEINSWENGPDIVISIIRTLAEISPFVLDPLDEQLTNSLENIFKTLVDYLPNQPENKSEDEENSNPPEPNLQFTHMEGLLFAFINLLKLSPDFLMSSENAERYKDLKIQLQFLARGVSSTAKMVRESLAADKEKTASIEETKQKTLTFRTMINITALIKELFRTPPTFKTTITLAWKPVSVLKPKMPISAPIKREFDMDDFAGDRKQPRRDITRGRDIYMPPSGKFSRNMDSYSNRGRGSGGYYPRGRGWGRRYY